MTWNPAGFAVTVTPENCQARLAWQVCLRPYKDWLNSRWGFNAGALLEEAIDRLKLFIESQYVINFEAHSENWDERTLALRCINLPGQGLMLGLLGKICTSAEKEIESKATSFGREIEAVFPHDFSLFRATTSAAFLQIAGDALLTDPAPNIEIAQIRRSPIFFPSTDSASAFSGFWQASLRSSEQIWRILASTPRIAMLNIAMRPTVIYEQEKQLLQATKQNIAGLEKGPLSTAYLSLAENYFKRRLTLWKKVFSLQVHVVMAGGMDESLPHNIGAALTRDIGDQASPGFRIFIPPTAGERIYWKTQLLQMNLTPLSYRLDELADVDEVLSVFRLPYLPETGLPGVTILDRL